MSITQHNEFREAWQALKETLLTINDNDEIADDLHGIINKLDYLYGRIEQDYDLMREVNQRIKHREQMIQELCLAIRSLGRYQYFSRFVDLKESDSIHASHENLTKFQMEPTEKNGKKWLISLAQFSLGSKIIYPLILPLMI